MKLVLTWRDADFDDAPVGGKARALGALSRAGFPVPAWCVILPAAMQAQYSDILGELQAFLDEADPGALWAVRSSAVDEDGTSHSFAGQLESYLNVATSALRENIAAVWRSGFSERIILYRQQAGLSLPPPPPGVIVQRMVPASAAGVAFSADPVSGRRGLAVVAAVAGLGEALVAGEKTGDSFSINRAGEMVNRTLAEEPSGLSDAEVIAIAALARRAEKYFGQPQDIEWAIAEGKLHLLQSRPITSLATLPDPDGAWQLWDNSNIAESYSGVTTPLTFAFARHVYEEVYRQFVKILRVPAARIEANRDVFGRMLGLVNGRVFYNLLSWYRVLAMLPGFAINREFMEQMMGVKEGLPEEALAQVVGPPRRTTLRDYLEIASTLGGLVLNHQQLPAKTRAFYERLNEALALRDTPLEEMRPDELAACYRRLQNQLLTRWDAPLINDFFAMIYFGLSRKLVAKWCGDEDGTLQNDLIACQGGIISAEPAQRILRLAQLARATPALLPVLARGSLRDIEQAIENEPAFAVEYHAYVEKFGDRCLEELKLESATLHDDPLLLLRSVAQLASTSERANASQTPKIAAAAAQRVAVALRGHPLRRVIFDFVVNRTRDRVRDRENLRFERTRVFGRVRRIFVELGRRLRGLEVLEDPRDVFYLSPEEVLGFVEGTAITIDLKALARLRRAEFARWKTEPVAERFETRGVVYVGHRFTQKPTTSDDSPLGETRKGIGCCPGVIRGRARVILDPRNADILPGEILVAPRTDPGWIMLFPAAAGLLVEHGSLLSHSAIVAREMGIPAVVSIAGLTAWLQTGDEVELDGGTGRITRLSAPQNEVANGK